MQIDVAGLAALLRAPSESALLDVREARQACGPHIALARSAPLSGLELLAPDFLPRRDTPVVVHDLDDAPDGPAARAQALLLGLGWTDVRRLSGGLRAWEQAGLPLIDGYGALIKSFGDLVRQHYATPTLSLEALEQRLRQGDPTTLVDVRPAGEYAHLSIAGARNYAGTELALRALPPPDAVGLWAVNCFSRTRGIIGSTTLRLLGARQVAFVEDGVMAWGLRGAPVVQNAWAPDDLPAADPAELRARADALVACYGLQRIDRAGLAALSADASRSRHLFDLRTSGPVAAGARRVAGGQLLMHFENLVGSRGARLVLIDEPHGLRAAVTAFWLTQFNQCEVLLLDGEPPPSGPVAAPPEDDGHSLQAEALAELLKAGRAVVVDVGPSADYEAGHLPGAFFLLPATLQPAEALLSATRTVVFTSPDGQRARLAARDLRAVAGDRGVAWLAGGTAGWRAAGLPLEQRFEPGQLLTPFDDDFGSVMRIAGPRREAAWRDYLAWERGVAERILRDPAVRFRLFPLPHQATTGRGEPAGDQTPPVA